MNQKIISIEITPNSDSVLTENGGVMWEHNATSLKFIIDTKLVGDYRYYIEYRSLMGTRVRTEYLDLNTEDNTIIYSIPVTMSSLKGVECWFNIVSIDDDGNTQQVIKSAKFCLSFDYSPDTDNRLCKVNDFSINSLLEAIRLGTFKGEKGEKGDRGEKGEQGEKGEAGEISVAYANKAYANAIAGRVSAEIVSVDDVSPLEHQVKITLKNKNLWQLSSSLEVPTSGSGYEISQEVNITEPIVISLKKTEDAATTAGVWIIKLTYADGTFGYVTYSGISALTHSRQFTASVQNPIVLLTARNSTVISGKYYDIQLEYGTEATEYVPYADIADAKVTVAGKNLFDIKNSEGFTSQYDGLTNEIGADSITVACTANSRGGYLKLGTFPAGDYYISADFSGSGTLFVGETRETAVTTSKILPVQHTLNEQSTLWVYCVFESADSPKTISNIQVETGTVRTDYETPKVSVCISNVDGKADWVTSVSPNMTIFSDVAKIKIECEYNKDTNKVIERLANAIVSLGGNV